MGIKTFENILKAGETTCIEFKRAGEGAKNDTFETVCSFLNRLGGDILLGVTDNGDVIGIPENTVEQIIRNIINITNDPNLLSPSFYFCPIAKNPIIASFFNQIGRADELGSGVRNLYKYVHFYSGADPVFDEEDVFKLTIPLDDDYSPEQGKSSEKSSEKTSQKILKMVAADANITIKQMAENLSLSTRAVEKQIAKLREKNLLSRDGADNGGSWVILSNDKKDV